MQRFGGARRHALAAQGAIDASNLIAKRGNIDVIRAILLAGVALAAAILLIYHYVQYLQLGFAVENLQRPAQHAERTQQPGPVYLQTQQCENPPEHHQRHQPGPELERVGRGAQRAYILAPEAVDEESENQHDAQRHQTHPEDYLPFETGSYRIIRIQMLAEQLAGSDGHVCNPEQQAVFCHAQYLVQPIAVLDIDTLYLKSLACLEQQIFYGAYRAEICAEQLAEKDYRQCQHDTHHDLHGGHRAGERAALDVSRQRLQSAHGAVGLRVCGAGLGEQFCRQAGQEE